MAGSGGYFRPGNNIFIGGGGETLMVGGKGNDQFYAGSNNLFDGGDDVMIGGSGANYFDCGPNGNGVILDFNPAKGDTKAPNCKFVITYILIIYLVRDYQIYLVVRVISRTEFKRF